MPVRLPFRQVVALDFEFSASPGERPRRPVCMVARELHSGQLVRLWEDEFQSRPPFGTGADTLYIAFAIDAELGCHLALGWPLPTRLLDLRIEQLWATNNLQGKRGVVSLLSTLADYGLDGIGADEKETFRNLAIRGGPYTSEEREGLLNYCQGDVAALERLLPKMLPRIDLPRALIRGRYMAAVTRMQWCGVPIDTELLERLRTAWLPIQDRMIVEVDRAYGVYEGRSFRERRFVEYLRREQIAWPYLESGRLALDRDTFRAMANVYPKLYPLYELRCNLGKLRLSELQVGGDGRNRVWLNPFGTRTGRNMPSNARFIFGPSVWLRGLIRPSAGQALAYIDWKQQEFGIAAALSGDEAMKTAYTSGDPYLAFAKQAGDVPEDGTKQSHPQQRAHFKACVLGLQYGMGAYALAQSINKQTAVARRLLRLNQELYSTFWRFSDTVLDHTLLTGKLHTVLGWQQYFANDPNPRAIRNFPMQANGAEMLRLACCLATEADVEVVAPVHDAVLIAAPVDRIEEDVAKMQTAMASASRTILGGFELATDVDIIRWPGRFMDEDRGRAMWDKPTLKASVRSLDATAFGTPRFWLLRVFPQGCEEIHTCYGFFHPWVLS